VNVAGLALRNLARNRRRTALSLATVACGTAAIVLTAGFVRFSFEGLSEALIHGGLGHLEVAAAGEVARRGAATLDRPAAAGLEAWAELRAELERLPHVRAVGANLHLMGLVQKPDGASVSFVGVGVEPERERRMGFTTKLRAGRALEDASPAPGEEPALVGRGLAESLDVAVGDRVTLLATDVGGMLNALDVEIVGVVTTGIADLDTRWLEVPLATGQRLLATERVSNLLVGLDDTRRTEAVAKAARAALAGRDLAVVPWHERAPFYRQVRGLYTGIFRFLGAIVAVLVVLAASNTLVMTVFERMRELGVLRAIGTTPGQIAALLGAEAAWLGLLGGAAGAALGAVATVAINAAGLTLPPPPGAVDPIDLRLAHVPEALAGAALAMVVVLLVAAIVPIVRAVRVEVIDALGHV
jgi:putative ABC transport system permease protein